MRELAGQLGLPYAVRHIDAAALALENHLSVEEAGRDARYAFFAETAGEGGASPPPTPWMIPLKRC